MFFKKGSQPVETEADKIRARLLHQLFAAQNHLEECAELVIVRQGVIDLYPDGPDKKLAESDLAKAKYSLLCAIGTADGIRTDLLRHIKEHSHEFVATADWNVPDGESASHKVIERTWKKFFLRQLNEKVIRL